MRRAVAVGITFLTLASGSLFAALSPKYDEFAKGPAQWIMTRDEQRDWHANVKTDDDAQHFIDLFWARRDPTPGTFKNEAREEFDQRVRFADKAFTANHLRGSLSERGRFYILLGPPSDLGRSGKEASMVNNSENAGGGRQLGGRDIWIWKDADAEKFGMRTFQAVFIQDVHSGQYFRDTQRTEVMAAIPAAMEKQIISPNMTQVPAWAYEQTAKIVAAPQQASIAHTETETTTQTIKKTVVVPDAPVSVAGKAGAHSLVLLKNVESLQPQNGRDPWSHLSGVEVFSKSDELGYALEYCSASFDAINVPTIQVAMSVEGMAGGEKVSMKAPADDVTPDSIKARPGCYMIRGSLPLADMEAGDYQLGIALQDKSSKQSYNLTQHFRVN